MVGTSSGTGAGAGTGTGTGGSSVSTLPSLLTPAIFAQQVLGFDDYETEEEKASEERHQRRERDRRSDGSGGGSGSSSQQQELQRRERERDARRPKDWKKEARDKKDQAEANKKLREDRQHTNAPVTHAANATDDAYDDDDAIDWEGDPAEMGAFVLGRVVEEAASGRHDKSNVVSAM